MVFSAGHAGHKRVPRLGEDDPGMIAKRMGEIILSTVKPTDVCDSSYISFSFDKETQIEKCTMDAVDRYFDLMRGCLETFPGPALVRKVVKEGWWISSEKLVPHKDRAAFASEEADKHIVLWGYVWTTAKKKGTPRSAKMCRLKHLVMDALLDLQEQQNTPDSGAGMSSSLEDSQMEPCVDDEALEHMEALVDDVIGREPPDDVQDLAVVGPQDLDALLEEVFEDGTGQADADEVIEIPSSQENSDTAYPIDPSRINALISSPCNYYSPKDHRGTIRAKAKANAKTGGTKTTKAKAKPKTGGTKTTKAKVKGDAGTDVPSTIDGVSCKFKSERGLSFYQIKRVHEAKVLVQLNSNAVPAPGFVCAVNVLQTHAAKGSSKAELTALKKQLVDAWASADEQSRQNAHELFKPHLYQAMHV